MPRSTPIRRLSPAEADAKANAMYQLLEAHARNGMRCPSLPGMSTGLGIGIALVQTLLERLREEKRISWKMEWSVESGPLRVVTITATGAVTQGVAGLRKARRQPKVDPLAIAKTQLRRLGCYVWDADIDGGPKGFIRVDRDLLKPADVIARAQRTVSA